MRGTYTENWIKILICFSKKITVQTQGALSKVLKITSVNLCELHVSVVKT
jgi:hypothetical protein